MSALRIPSIAPEDGVLTAALDVARDLARRGVPVFLAAPAVDEAGRWLPDGGHNGCGYWLPNGWQRTQADPAVLDRWRPGMAVAAVMGHTVDGLDADPRSGGDRSRAALMACGVWPRAVGTQATPSGGTHDLVSPLGVRSRDGVLPGLDVKAGHRGEGHGFLWIAPTVRLSKTTGVVAPYRWLVPPMLDELDPADDTGHALAARIAALRTDEDDTPDDLPHDAHEAMGEGQRAAVGRYLAAVVRQSGEELAHAVTWPEGRRDDRGRGWQKLTADACNRFGRLARADWTPWSHADARAALRSAVPPAMAAAVGLEATWQAQRDRRGPAPYPSSLADGEAGEAWLDALASTPRAQPAQASAEPGPEDDSLDEVVRQRFRRLDLAALLAPGRPPREWVVHALIPAGASVSLVAPAGTGKSLLLLALVLHLTRGRRTFAGLAIPRPRRVLLIDMENTEDDLADRLVALGVTPADAPALDALVIVHLPPLAPLDTAVGGMELAAILDAYAVTSDDVVVLDSLQRVTEGAESDSDTYRAYYRHCGLLLKRRGVTVIRTDNTGKDTDKGARGSSGKRDDVDVELILTRDADHPERLRIRPGKVRLPSIASLLVRREVDDDGRLSFTTAGDPFRVLVTEAHALLDELGVPTGTGERKAADMVRAACRNVPIRAALRQAVKERKEGEMSNLTAPNIGGALTGAPPSANRAEHPRRTDGAPESESASSQVRGPIDRAEHPRRTDGAPEPGAPAAGAPPLPLYKERRTGARLPVESAPEGVDPARESETWPPGSIGEEANGAAPVHDLAETIAELGGKCPDCGCLICACEDAS